MRWSRELSQSRRYAGAVSLVAVAGVSRYLIIDHPSYYPFTFFNPAILLCAFFFGRWTGIFATVLSGAVASYVFMPQALSWRLLEGNHEVALSLFILLNVILSYVIGSMHVLIDRLEAAVLAVRESDSQKTLLLRETAHRNRNDLQRLAASIGWQAALNPSVPAKLALTTAESRVAAMASLTGRLDITQVLDGHGFICSQTFLSELLDDLKQTVGDRPIRFEQVLEAYPLPTDVVVPLGLIVNEMITNSLKYAFPHGRAGTIRVEFQRLGGDFVLRVGDDGVGILEKSKPQGGGLGMKIAKSFATTIGGALVMEKRPEGQGTLCVVRFPADRKSVS